MILVSSHKIISQDFKISMARKVMSPRFPIGVATIKNSDMKKILITISISFILLLTSCKSSSDLFIDKYIADQADVRDHSYSSNVFDDHDLETIYANKKKVKIALFLPFSGKSRDLAWSLYNAALLSLFDNDINHNLEIILIDSKDNAVEASRAFAEIKNRDIKIVIGPIFSNFTSGIAKNALRNSVKVISLSNNQDLMGNIDKKGAVFVSGFLPEQEIDRIVSFALENDKKNFAILAPNNNYGIAISKMFKDVIKRRDGHLIQSELYNNSETDLKSSVIRIINAYKVSKELAEGGGNKLEKDFRIKESDKNYADVIFVAENAANLTKIAKLIEKYNTDEREIQIAGINAWDNVSLLNDSSLNGIWFAAPIHERFASFEKSYYQTYGKIPPRISSIVYDSVAALAQIVEKTENSNPQTQDFVDFEYNGKIGFEGIDGKFRFLENGLTQRNLAVLEVKSGKLKVVAEPTSTFLQY